MANNQTARNRVRFQTQRRLVSDMITTQKSDYFLSEITRCGKDQKALFRVVDTLLHRRSKLVLPEHDDIQDILEMFGSFFSDKIQKIRQNLNSHKWLTRTFKSYSAPSGTSSRNDWVQSYHSWWGQKDCPWLPKQIMCFGPDPNING